MQLHATFWQREVMAPKVMKLGKTIVGIPAKPRLETLSLMFSNNSVNM